MAITLTPEPLTTDVFATYGDVLEPESASEERIINEGNTVRFHDLANLVLDAQSGHPTVNIFRSSPLPRPLELTTMERHPLSSQAFFPLGDDPYLVVVAPPGDLNVADVRAFIASSTQGVNYKPGTWHHYSLALGETSDFLVIDRDGPGEDCDELELPEPILIDLS